MGKIKSSKDLTWNLSVDHLTLSLSYLTGNNTINNSLFKTTVMYKTLTSYVTLCITDVTFCRYGEYLVEHIIALFLIVVGMSEWSCESVFPHFLTLYCHLYFSEMVGNQRGESVLLVHVFLSQVQSTQKQELGFENVEPWQKVTHAVRSTCIHRCTVCSVVCTSCDHLIETLTLLPY